jgi:hypothetical protein
MLNWCLATALVFGTSVAAIAQSLSKAPVIATEANWKVLQIKDGMTDKVSCVAIYKGNHDIQLSPGALYISYRGRGGVPAGVMDHEERVLPAARAAEGVAQGAILRPLASEPSRRSGTGPTALGS